MDSISQPRRETLQRQAGGGAVRHSADDAGACRRAVASAGAGRGRLRVQAEQNRIRKEPVLAPRGKLFDREGRLIVDNYPSVSCFLVREQNQNIEADLPMIARGLHLDLDQLRATLRHLPRCSRLSANPHQAGSDADEDAFIESHRNELPELETLDEERRLYPRDGFASHLIGYVGEVSEDDPERSALCRVQAGRRGGQGRRRGDLRPAVARRRTARAT